MYYRALPKQSCNYLLVFLQGPLLYIPVLNSIIDNAILGFLKKKSRNIGISILVPMSQKFIHLDWQLLSLSRVDGIERVEKKWPSRLHYFPFRFDGGSNLRDAAHAYMKSYDSLRGHI
jgi:hypothetical protein